MSCNFYAVADGNFRGIFSDYEQVEKSVKKYSGAKFKGFNSYIDALEYLNKYLKIPYCSEFSAYLSGVYIDDAGTAFGLVLYNGNEVIPFCSMITDERLGTLKWTSGEMCAAIHALMMVHRLNIKNINIYYSQDLVEICSRKKANPKKESPKVYNKMIRALMNGLNVNFYKFDERYDRKSLWDQARKLAYFALRNKLQYIKITAGEVIV